MHKQNSPLEGSSVFSFVLAADVGNILQDQLPLSGPDHTDTSHTTPCHEGGGPKEETHTQVNNKLPL